MILIIDQLCLDMRTFQRRGGIQKVQVLIKIPFGEVQYK